MKMINFLIFYIQYFAFNVYNKIFGKKSKKYMLVFFGRFPENFKHVIKPVVDYENELRFTFGPGSLIIIFSSKKDLKELNHLFNKMYSEYIDMYFLFNITNGDYGKYCLDMINNHLFYESKTQLTINEKIDKIQVFIDMVFKMRDEVRRELQRNLNKNIEDAEYVEVNENTSFGEITEDQVNIIIDKIRESGFESLTEQEQQIYNKVFKK
jgi:hypothetical protein